MKFGIFVEWWRRGEDGEEGGGGYHRQRRGREWGFHGVRVLPRDKSRAWAVRRGGGGDSTYGRGGFREWCVEERFFSFFLFFTLAPRVLLVAADPRKRNYQLSLMHAYSLFSIHPSSPHCDSARAPIRFHENPLCACMCES